MEENESIIEALRQPVRLDQGPLQLLLDSMFKQIQSQAAQITEFKEQIVALSGDLVSKEELMSRVRLLEQRQERWESGELNPIKQAELARRLEDVERTTMEVAEVVAELSKGADARDMKERLCDLESRVRGVHNLVGHMVAVTDMAVQLGVDIPLLHGDEEEIGMPSEAEEGSDASPEATVSNTRPLGASEEEARTQTGSQQVALGVHEESGMQRDEQRGRAGQSGAEAAESSTEAGGRARPRGLVVPEWQRDSMSVHTPGGTFRDSHISKPGTLAILRSYIDELFADMKQLRSTTTSLREDLTKEHDQQSSINDATALRLAAAEADAQRIRAEMAATAGELKSVIQGREAPIAEMARLSGRMEALISKVNEHDLGLADMSKKRIPQLLQDLEFLQKSIQDLQGPRESDYEFQASLKDLEKDMEMMKKKLQGALSSLLGGDSLSLSGAARQQDLEEVVQELSQKATRDELKKAAAKAVEAAVQYVRQEDEGLLPDIDRFGHSSGNPMGPGLNAAELRAQATSPPRPQTSPANQEGALMQEGGRLKGPIVPFHEARGVARPATSHSAASSSQAQEQGLLSPAAIERLAARSFGRTQQGSVYAGTPSFV